MIFYLDASAWLKRYVIETGSKRIRQWFAKGPILAVSPLGFIEVVATLTRKEQAGELDTDDMHASLASADADYDRFAIVPIDTVITIARQLPVRYRLRGADTIHLAAAIWLNNLPTLDGETLALVTSDRELAEAASDAELDVFDPTRDALPTP